MRNFITIVLSLTTLLCLGCSPEAQNNTTTGRPPLHKQRSKPTTPLINPDAPPLNPEATKIPEGSEDTKTPEASENTEASEATKTTFNIGDKVPGLTNLTYLQGPEATFTDPENQTIHLIEFWETWCGGCRDVAPKLSALQNQYPDRLRIIGITPEKEATVNSYLAKNPGDMTYTVALDPGDIDGKIYYNAVGLYDANGWATIPQIFLVDATGTLLWYGEPTDKALTKKLESLMITTKS